MKRPSSKLVASLSLAFVLGLSLMAQEQTEITVQVKKDGKVLKDTTYQFEDEASAKQAMKMMEVLGGHHMHTEDFNYTMAHSGEGHSKTMVFVSKDGEKTVIKEMHGDSLAWTEEGGHPHQVHTDGEHVIVMKSGGGEHVKVRVDEDGTHDVVLKSTGRKNVQVPMVHGILC